MSRIPPSWPAAVLMVGGAGLLCYSLAEVTDARLFDQREKALLAKQARFETKEPRPLVANGSGQVVGRVDIARVGISAVVVDSVDKSSLRRAVGLVPGTAWPGVFGNAVLAGHRDLHFRGLKEIRKGDEITITLPSESVHYEVTRTYVLEPNDASRILGDKTADLTLLTCFPFSYIGPAPKRFVAQARRVPR